MSTTYRQAGRLLTVDTPLGTDKLLLIGLSGTESLSELFHFQLELIATNETQVPFEALLGKKITAHVRAPGGNLRHFSGICSRIAQGGRDPYFTSFRAEVVPEFWFLTRKAQSRIFQAKTVPQILQKVLEGLQVDYRLSGQYEPRDYCVQYRETDFNFACRLMEEEGIFYFFEHSQSAHKMVLGDAPSVHPAVPFDPKAVFAALAESTVDEDRITEWQKTQELRSTKFTLWDHCFELPHQHLEAEKPLMPNAQVGQVGHKLVVGDANRLEVYDWPGEYAQRFDGVDPNRGDRPGDIQKIFQDNRRTVDVRMQQEAAACLMIAGSGQLRQLTAGHRFTLDRHFDANGDYVLTSVQHTARQGSNVRSGEADELAYQNSFTCLPASVPYRPQRVTPKPTVTGTQTAVVVGPKGEEIYTDKYGRVKVQFHWDREGKHDVNSSCWIRVAQGAGGRRWGTSFWPRIGQEVLVDHIEGDPDQPIIVGTVYNADQMPPYLGKGPDGKHPDDNMLSGYKSNTTKGGSGYNEWRFDDTKDKQQIFMHAERNMDTRVKHDCMEFVINDRHLIVGKDGKGNQYERIEKDKHLHVKGQQVELIDKSLTLTVGGGYDLIVKGGAKVKVQGDQSNTFGSDLQEKVGMNWANETGMETHLKAGMKMVLEAGMQLTLKGPGGFIDIGPTGVTIQGILVNINSGGAPGVGSGAHPSSPQEAKPKDPTEADDAVTGQKSC